MSDATGHMDWPGAGPMSLQVPDYQGHPTDDYTHPDYGRNRILLIRINKNSPDTMVAEFGSAELARNWLLNELEAGRRP
jgi:hypothetical protein